MENPVKEISGVIHMLVQTPPSQQRETIETYFTPNASFTHPFCQTRSFNGSRFFIRAIYRWYKIMSPHIDITVHSVAYDEQKLLLYVSLSQIFRIWVLPFHKAPVDFVTFIRLEHNEDDGKYYIASQNDLYQVDQWVKFIPFFVGSHFLVLLWHFWTTGLCLLGTLVLWPVTVVEELVGRDSELRTSRKKQNARDGLLLQDLERKSRVNG